MDCVKQKFAGLYAQDRRRPPEACGSLSAVPPETPNPRTSGLGVVLSHIRSGDAVTRATLAQRTGLARSTVAQRVDALLESGLIYEAGDSVSTGGRRPGLLAFNPRAELRIPVTSSVQTALFIDTGNLWSSLRAFEDLKFRLRYTAGTGIRIGTPVGPLVFDYGFNLERVLDELDPSRKNQRFWEDLGTFHFSIGLF